MRGVLRICHVERKETYTCVPYKSAINFKNIMKSAQAHLILPKGLQRFTGACSSKTIFYWSLYLSCQYVTAVHANI